MSDLAKHYYDEAVRQMRGPIRNSFERQKKDALRNIEHQINEVGPQTAVSQLHTLVAMSQSYQGRGNPYLYDVFNASLELMMNDIAPDRREFRDQVRAMGERNLLRTATSDGRPFENAAENTLVTDTSDPLGEALAFQKAALAEATRYGQEDKAQTHERNIERIERQIQATNPPPTHKQPDRSVDGPNQQAADALERELLDVRSHTEGERAVHSDSIVEDYSDEDYVGWDEDFTQ